MSPDPDDASVRFSLLELGGVPQPDARTVNPGQPVTYHEQPPSSSSSPASPNRVPIALEKLDTQHGYRCGFHPRIAVSEHTPVVTCTVCGERLDPYEVLREFRRKERSFAYELEDLREERTRLTAEVAELKRERNNLRAQVRRATRNT